MSLDVTTLDGHTITEFQSCKRKALLAHDWRYLKWRPSSLFLACFREAIIAISQGTPAASATSIARSTFLQSAANPGLELSPSSHFRDVYRLAKDWCAMLDTTLEAASRTGLVPLTYLDPVRLTSGVEWKPLAFAGADGSLHRWMTCDRWDGDELARALHSWYVIGDLAVTRTPLTLHVIEIGQLRQGRRASSWARGWKHPKIINARLRFKRRADPPNRTDRAEFHDYRAWYLSDHPDITAVEWVDRMAEDGAIADVMREVKVSVPSPEVCDDTVRQVLQESATLRDAITDRGALGWAAHPMSRAACDWPVPCPWQNICFASKPTCPSELPDLYQRRRATSPDGHLPTSTPSSLRSRGK